MTSSRILAVSFLVLALIGFVPASHALGFTTPVKAKFRLKRTQLPMGLFDFKPFGGGGSGKTDLDEQWEAQQAILRARQGGGIDKEHLREKYKDRSENQFNKMVKENEEAKKNRPSKVEETYEEDQSSQKRPKFFWEQ